MSTRASGSLWLGKDALVLASRSSARRLMLSACGIEAELVPADLDERSVEAEAAGKGALPAAIARLLAAAKARSVSVRLPSRLVLGADQVLAFEDRCWAKPRSRAEAASHLTSLAGREHRLVSACAIARDGLLLYEAIEIAELRMRELTAREIDDYLDIIGDEALASVGSYRIEGIGRLLFDRVDADQAVILGLPLAGLARYFRSVGLTRL